MEHYSTISTPRVAEANRTFYAGIAAMAGLPGPEAVSIATVEGLVERAGIEGIATLEQHLLNYYTALAEAAEDDGEFVNASLLDHLDLALMATASRLAEAGEAGLYERAADHLQSPGDLEEDLD